MMDISIPYYSDFSRISNSNIGWFLNKGPAFLHKMLTDPPPEEKNSTLERGTMIHSYLLTPEEFQKDYVVWDKRRPSSAQQEKFCQELANSVEIEPNKAVLSAYQASYSTTNRSEEKMLSEGLKIASELKEYIDFLKSGDSRKMIGPWDVEMLKKIKGSFAKHKLARQLLWPLEFRPNDLEWFHEFHINWEYYIKMAAGVKCKSLLDGLTLDFGSKTAIIYDLKTTQKLWHFEESIHQYDYLRQLCFYYQAVVWYLRYELRVKNWNDWTFKFYIIGIDTTGSNEIRVFEIDKDDVYSRKDTILDAMQDIWWHQTTDQWDHTRAYYEGDGSEKLNL